MPNVRLLKLSGIYKNYYPIIYKDLIPNHAELSYQVHYQKVMDLKIAEFDSYKINLEKLGDFECMEVVADDERLQKKWASEHQVKYDANNWKKEIVIAQIAHFKPTVLLDSHHSFLPAERKEIKNKYNIKLTLAWDGTVHTDKSKLADIDVILTCIDNIKKEYESIGKQAVVLPFSFEPTILDQINLDKKYEVSFCGSIFRQFHKNRIVYLNHLLDNDIPLSPFIGNIITGSSIISRPLLRELAQFNFGFAKHLYQFQRINLGSVFGKNMYQTIAQSKITLNFHGDSVTEAGNMRLMEATGSGACLVTDWKPNIKDYFKPGEEIVTFKSKEEALEKIRYLLKHKEERERIAKAGQKRTLSVYNNLNRMKKLKKLILEHLN